jgi:hypothetical protein
MGHHHSNQNIMNNNNLFNKKIDRPPIPKPLN